MYLMIRHYITRLRLFGRQTEGKQYAGFLISELILY